MNNLDNPQLSKKERRLLKREQKEQERQRKIKNKKRKTVIKVAVISLVFIGALTFFYLNSTPAENGNIASSNQGAPKVAIEKKFHDAGQVSMADGNVVKTFEIKNTGQGDLKISKMRTSCMCTSANLTVGDKKSPKFGMHKNSSFWSQTIPPGQTGFLEMTFDPAFHGPDGTGSVMRAVYFSTNDPEHKEMEVRLSANVTQ